MIILERFKG